MTEQLNNNSCSYFPGRASRTFNFFSLCWWRRWRARRVKVQSPGEGTRWGPGSRGSLLPPPARLQKYSISTGQTEASAWERRRPVPNQGWPLGSPQAFLTLVLTPEPGYKVVDGECPKGQKDLPGWWKEFCSHALWLSGLTFSAVFWHPGNLIGQ